MEKHFQKTPLKVPEYGRIIQSMVDRCTAIEDKTERQKCAEYIIFLMAKKTQTKLDDPESMKVLWDHLFIMSHFSLDIDFPVEVTSKEGYTLLPEKVPYTSHLPRFRHYGHAIEKMIKITAATEDPELKKEREKITAIQMKKAYLTWNKSEVKDEKIFKDLYEMSDSEIYLDEFDFVLPDFNFNSSHNNNTGNNKNQKRRNKKKKK